MQEQVQANLIVLMALAVAVAHAVVACVKEGRAVIWCFLQLRLLRM